MGGHDSELGYIHLSQCSLVTLDLWNKFGQNDRINQICDFCSLKEACCQSLKELGHWGFIKSQWKKSRH